MYLAQIQSIVKISLTLSISKNIQIIKGVPWKLEKKHLLN